MEQFIVSARKYRPTTFDVVVGQKSITNTLKNAIRNNQLAQAYLFCGSRGVGKTTCARILAKTINCLNRTENIEPCNTCESCVSFNEGNSLNIYELDAASNNGVDEIRELINQVRIPPQIGTKKVYIIDEVHMLSQAAFNAFLKTLEEPPKHAIFILATTEKHKILPTILSRCQIFDFNRITVADMVEHLKGISIKEGIEAEEDGLRLIAAKADGALRDALSIFDQVVAFCGKTLTYKAIAENLNVLDYDTFFKLSDFILQGDIPSTLLLLDDTINHGYDGHLIINGMAGHFRNLLICKQPQTHKLLEVSDAAKTKYVAQAEAFSARNLLTGIELLNQSDLNYKQSQNQRLLTELTFMQLCSMKENEAEKKKS
ncbi:MAG: DNA polymerase III subunit gamma/tau [Luteibaculaceae bacterium]